MTTVVTKTRSGRTVKQPERLEPAEICEDDWSDGEHDTDYDISDSDLCETEDEDENDDDDDADENGILKGFVVDDESESEEED